MNFVGEAEVASLLELRNVFLVAFALNVAKFRLTASQKTTAI